MGGVIDPWLVAGSSLYWAAVVFSFAFDGVSISPAAEPSSAVLAYVLVTLMLLCFIPIRQVFERRRSRQMVALTMALVVGVYTATSSLATVPRIASGIVSLAYLAEVACQMVLWGFAYASLDKSRAYQNVCCTVLVVVTLVSLSSILYKLTETCCLACLLNIASLLVIASGRVFFSSHDRAASGGMQRPLAFFVISRVFFGAFMGFCIQLPKGPGIADSSTPMTILAILICCGMLLFFILSRYPLGAFMPVTLATGVVLLYLPHANEGLRALVSSAAGLTWLAWATMSAVQLSDFKETCGFREFTLCAIEKSVLSLSIVAGSLLSPLVHWGDPRRAGRASYTGFDHRRFVRLGPVGDVRHVPVARLSAARRAGSPFRDGESRAVFGALSGDRQRIQAVRSRAADNGAPCGGVLAHVYSRLPWRFRGNHQGACVSHLSENRNPPQG